MRVRTVSGFLLSLLSFSPATVASVVATERRAVAPVAFELNRGQFGSEVQFVARGSGYRFGILPTGFVVEVRERRGPEADRSPNATRRPAVERVRLHFEDSPGARLSGVERLERVSNYYFGADPSKWLVGVPTFARVRMADVYPGIDALVYERDGLVEYDLVVAPGADPAVVTLVADADISIDPGTGELVVDKGEQRLRQHPPLAYQRTASGGQEEVRARFVSRGPGRIGIELGTYDATRALVIDPVLSFSTFLGGSGIEDAYAVAVDTAGRVVVAGWTSSVDFPITAGAYDISPGAHEDGFVARYDASGSQLEWATYLAGDVSDWVYGVAVDPAGNIYVTGTTSSSDFPITSGAFQPQHRCSWPATDPFVTKLSPYGAVLYSTYLGGCGAGVDVAVNASGEAYVVGHTQLGDFPTVNPLQADKVCCGAHDLFISRLNSSGSGLLYSTYLGGSGDENARAIGLSAAGHVVVASSTTSLDYPVAAVSGYSTPQATYGGGISDAVVSMLEADGSKLRHSTYLGGSGLDRPMGLVVAPGGDAFVVGETTSTDFPVVTSGFGATSRGAQEGFLARLRPDNGQVPFATFIGGRYDDYAAGVDLDSSNNMVVAGRTCSDDLPLQDALQAQPAGNCDAFVMTVPPGGAAPLFSTYLGGSGEEWALDLAVRGDDSIVLAGGTRSTDFPTQSPVQGTHGGNQWDAFVTGISAGGASCTVSCTASVPATGTTDTAVSFQGTATPSAGCSGYLGFDWDFGDGSAHASTHDPDHTYASPGTYSWTFTASVGGTTCTRTGTIVISSASCTPPALMAQPQNAVVPSGASATLRVGAAGTSPLSYQWYQGSAGSTGSPVAAATSPTLSIAAVTATAQYWVRVGNACGSVDSVAATVSPVPSGTSWNYLIPAVAHNPGSGGTLWRTDVGLLNVSGSTVTLHVTFFHGDGYPLAPVITALPTDRMRMWWNVLESLIGYAPSDNAAGALLIRADGPLTLTARTYNSTATGTYGQFVPAIALDTALQPGQTGYLPQLRSSSAFRTNVGLVNLGPDEAQVVIDLRDRDANLIATRTVTLKWGQWWQWNDAFGGTTYEPAFASVEVQTGGAVWAYGSVVDNRTGDATTVPVQLP